MHIQGNESAILDNVTFRDGSPCLYGDHDGELLFPLRIRHLRRQVKSTKGEFYVQYCKFKQLVSFGCSSCTHTRKVTRGNLEHGITWNKTLFWLPTAKRNRNTLRGSIWRQIRVLSDVRCLGLLLHQNLLLTSLSVTRYSDNTTKSNSATGAKPLITPCVAMSLLLRWSLSCLQLTVPSSASWEAPYNFYDDLKLLG